MAKAKKFMGIIALTIALLIAVAGCTECSSCDSSTRTQTTEETTMVPTLVADLTSTNREVSVKLPEREVIFIDISLSVDSPSAEQLRKACKDGLVSHPQAVVRDFSEFAHGEFNLQWTDIFSALREAKISGYDRVFILTDGWQDSPTTGWKGLMNEDYSFMDIYLVCLGKTQHTEELRAKLENTSECFQHSSLTLEYLDGTPSDEIFSGYQSEIIRVAVPDADTLYSLKWEEVSATSITRATQETGYWPWWVVLLAVLLAALFDLIHELITRNREDRLPTEAEARMRAGASVLADFSGSMTAVRGPLRRSCRKAGADTLMTFSGGSVRKISPQNVSRVETGGNTPGWEALKEAESQGMEDIVLISDLEFNGEPFRKDRFSKKFKSILVVAPSSHNQEVYRNLEEIAEKVEVVHL